GATLDAGAVQESREARNAGGRVVRLTGTLTSRTTGSLHSGRLSARPAGTHVVYAAVSSDAIAKAMEVTYGERLIPRYRLDRADLILTLGAAPLGTWLSPPEFARDFSSRRHPESGTMSRLVAIESILTLTGTNADTRY